MASFDCSRWRLLVGAKYTSSLSQLGHCTNTIQNLVQTFFALLDRNTLLLLCVLTTHSFAFWCPGCEATIATYLGT